MMSASLPVPRLRPAVVSLTWFRSSLRITVAGTCESLLSSRMPRNPILCDATSFLNLKKNETYENERAH